MKQQILKSLSLVLSLALILSAVSFSALAATETTVSNVEELLTAIENANEGDVISLSGTIEISESTTVGAADKKLLLCGENGSIAKIVILDTIPAEADVAFQNLTFAGSSSEASGIAIHQLGDCVVTVSDSTFLYTSGAEAESAYYAKAGTAIFSNCTFEGCKGINGGCIKSEEEASLYISGSNFSANVAQECGGSIYANGCLSLESSNFRNGSAGTLGGAIYAVSTLNVSDSSFYGCTAQSGGSIYCTSNSACIESTTFDSGYASENGGHIYGQTFQISSCQMSGGTAELDGGSIYALSDLKLTGSAITSNRAVRSGGGVYSQQNATVQDCKIFNNRADISGADLWSAIGLSILDSNEDYSTLFETELSAGGWNHTAWFSDKELERYSEESLTEKIATPCEMLQYPAHITFAMYYEDEAAADPEDPTPTPTPDEPDPVPPQNDESDDYTPPTIRPSRPLIKPVAKTPPLKCNTAVIDIEKAEEFCEFILHFIPHEKPLTREEMAGMIYGMLTTDCLDNLNLSKQYYTDTESSPYQSSIHALTSAGVFAGSGDGIFSPEAPATMAQMITVLSRFVDPKEYHLTNIHITGHWAESAVKTAVALDWIDDTAINLNAVVTMGDFVKFLTSVVIACQ